MFKPSTVSRLPWILVLWSTLVVPLRLSIFSLLLVSDSGPREVTIFQLSTPSWSFPVTLYLLLYISLCSNHSYVVHGLWYEVCFLRFCLCWGRSSRSTRLRRQSMMWNFMVTLTKSLPTFYSPCHSGVGTMKTLTNVCVCVSRYERRRLTKKNK